jgi:hypothetical protein
MSTARAAALSFRACASLGIPHLIIQLATAHPASRTQIFAKTSWYIDEFAPAQQQAPSEKLGAFFFWDRASIALLRMRLPRGCRGGPKLTDASRLATEPVHRPTSPSRTRSLTSWCTRLLISSTTASAAHSGSAKRAPKSGCFKSTFANARRLRIRVRSSVNDTARRSQRRERHLHPLGWNALDFRRDPAFRSPDNPYAQIA